MASEIDSNRIITSLKEWASESEQARLWLSTGKNGAEVSSFVEAQEQLFTDTGLGDELEKRRPVFSDAIDDQLRFFSDMLSNIDSNRTPLEIIHDDRMSEVRAAAQRLLTLIEGSI
ncbi:hypothetical protein [Sphingobium cloacae]|uniref:Uncharacterized protein n=1 Tax=Sphingobium cloacae TaxID=120107 RepID=A0A1E1F277_9SPHN|nr:hypothetical protein [Sphingobium cloacae]BAV64627.1 hypothetical protein SCLO_1015870 [Sphingobium cloacae]